MEDVPEPAQEGIAGKYVSEECDSISLYKDGTFAREKTPAGENSFARKGKALVFTFQDCFTRTWTVMSSDGKVAAIVSPRGTRYTVVER